MTLRASIPPALEAEIDELIGHYPERRSAVMMVLHALQDHFGHLGSETIEWTANKLGLRPINVLELVTFYPMFRRKAVGRFHLRICRTVSCALAGSHELHRHLCVKLGLDPHVHGPQTTPDGRFTVEFVECLASCGTAPVMMCNESLRERVTVDQADALLAQCTGDREKAEPNNLAAEHGFEP